MKKRILLAIAAIGATAPCFALHDLYGFYVNPQVGYDHLNLSNVHITMNNFNASTQLTKDSSSSNGVAYGIAAGYGLENLPIRLELEVASQQNVNYNASPLMGAGDQTGQNFSSRVSSYHVMANAIFDFHLNSYILPYLKVGAGVARNHTQLSDNFPSSDPPPNFGQPLTENVSTTRTGFAWQAGAGSAFRLDDNIYLNGELRYTNLGKVSWKDFYNATPLSGGNDSISLEAKALSSYQATVGLLWFFGGTRYTAPSPKMA